MINLNECKFGDRLRTMDGRMAIFMRKLSDDKYSIAVATTKERNDYFAAYYKRINGKLGYLHECQYRSEELAGNGDIVGKWEDEK